MNEVKLHQIQPAGGARPAERGQATNPATGHKWEQALRDAGKQLETVSRQVSAPDQAKPADPAALQDEVRRVNDQLQQMMKAHQNLSQLYHQIHKLDTGKG